jgi:hypothetical protein
MRSIWHMYRARLETSILRWPSCAKRWRASVEESRAIGERLLTAAIAQEDMDVVHESARGALPIPHEGPRDWIRAAGRRALELHTASELYVEPRRSGYIFGCLMAALGELPPDPAMDDIVAFYHRHRERTPALWRLERA